MIKLEGRLSMEVVHNDKVYYFNMPMQAPYQDCYDALFKMSEEIKRIANESVESAKRRAAESAAVEKQKEVIDPEVVQS